MTRNNEQGERREFSRVDTRPAARVGHAGGEDVFSAQVIDVSLGGVLIESDLRLPDGSEVTVSIPLGDEESGIVIRATGTIVRTDTAGVVIEFSGLEDPESYEYLRNLVLYNSTSPEPIEEEFRRHSGITRNNTT